MYMQAEIRDIAVLRCAARWDPYDQYAYEQVFWEAFGYLVHIDGNMWALLKLSYSKQVNCFLSNNKRANLSRKSPRPKRYRWKQDTVIHFHIEVTLNRDTYMRLPFLRISSSQSQIRE